MSNTIEATMQEPQSPQVDEVTEKLEALTLRNDSGEARNKPEVSDSSSEPTLSPTHSKPTTPGYNVQEATMQGPQPLDVDELTKRLDDLRLEQDRGEDRGEDADVGDMIEAQEIVDRIRAHPRRRKLGQRVQTLMMKFENDEK
ncbi:hypothetical protein BOTCAL_0099g00010 [Botryotinia calthae]|uniref:Uncharacterized protein n=1 Tax=Botryotinia calthae TaxID=38488 RepID=A0A4Y8D6Q9_9HELO|nr:hypothetical protein BOTCAL_0099g00010 [Botryotinia calthae]